MTYLDKFLNWAGVLVISVCVSMALGVGYGAAQTTGKDPSSLLNRAGNNGPRPKPALRTPPQTQAIESQEKGDFPKLQRETLPLGAINRQWAESCGQSDTTLAVAHQASKEIRFSIRQMLGSVVTFPERVSMVTGPAGTAFTARGHGSGGAELSNVWIFGATQAGLDGNFVFVGRERHGVPTMYLLHVQSEGYNTTSCPDLLVLIKPATSPQLANAASAMQEWAASLGGMSPARMVARVPAEPVPGETPAPKAAADGGAGRQETDWLEGRNFDPSGLDFRWTVRGEAGLAPDIVFSDCCSTYLKFAPERVDKVRIAAIHAVERTADGAIDAPVNWTFKGDTIVVQGVQKLTLEREGLVTCIDPDPSLIDLRPESVRDGAALAPVNRRTADLDDENTIPSGDKN